MTGPRRWRRPGASPAGWTPRACATSPARRTSSARTSRTSTSHELAGRREAAQRAIDADGLDVRLHPGGELADEDALELDERELELIAQGPEHAPWLLLECPFEGLDDVFDAAVARLTGLGYGLLLAHPERAAGALDRLDPHIEAGALLQVNVSSLLGDHGPQARETARPARAPRAAPTASPRTRIPAPASARSRSATGRWCAPARARSRPQRLTQSNPRFLLREGIPQPRAAAAQRRATRVNE